MATNDQQHKNYQSVTGKLDIPVDLGDGTIVLISGMPGRPTPAACERLCKIIMSFAFFPSAKKDTVLLESGDLKITEEDRTQIQTLVKPAPLGSKATQVAHASTFPLQSTNPEV